MSSQSNEPLKKEMHAAESEIDAIENKIACSDESEITSADVAVLRSEEEKHRQKALRTRSAMTLDIRLLGQYCP
jgi:hypothetical protein